MRKGGVSLTGAAIGLAFAAPLAVLVVQAFADRWRAPDVLPTSLGTRGFETAFGGAGGGEALGLSLLVAILTTIVSLGMGWPAATALARRGVRLRGLALFAIGLPLLMPPYLAGFGLVEWFIRLGIDGTLVGLVLAHVTFSLPYVILVLAAAPRRDVDRLEEMAGSAGLGRAQRLAWVTLPSMRPALSVAALLAFLVSWSQYGTSLAVGGARETLPVVLVPFVRSDPQVAASLALVFLVPCLVALLVAVRWRRVPL